MECINPSCKKTLKDGAAFCPYCATDQRSASTPSAPAAPPSPVSSPRAVAPAHDIPGELVVLSSNEDRLVLTTHRVRYRHDFIGGEEFKSIMLEELSFCAISYRSKPYLLALGVLIAVLFGLVGATLGATGLIGGEGMLISLVVMAVFVVLYLLSRRRALVLASSGGQIDVSTRGASTDTLVKFVDQAEACKAALRR